MLVGGDFQEVREAARKCRALQPRAGRALRPYRRLLSAPRRGNMFVNRFAVGHCVATFAFCFVRHVYCIGGNCGLCLSGKGSDSALSGEENNHS